MLLPENNENEGSDDVAEAGIGSRKRATNAATMSRSWDWAKEFLKQLAIAERMSVSGRGFQIWKVHSTSCYNQ